MLGDSLMSQLVLMTHKIYQSFNCDITLDVKGTFLDISKAFDKVWYEGLIVKLQTYAANGKLVNLI